MPHLKYDSVTNSIIYDGEEISWLTTLKLVNLEITFVNSFGENSYTQIIAVSPSVSALLPSEPDEEEEEVGVGEVVKDDTS